MSTPNTSDSAKKITLNIIKFPQNLVIPASDEIENSISFQAISNSNKKEKLKFSFEGENLQIRLPADLKEEIEFNPGETKDINIQINPVADGYGKLTVNVNHMELVEYIERIQKLREKVPKKRIKKMLKNRDLKESKYVSSFNPKDLSIKISKEELAALESQINLKRTQRMHVTGEMPGVVDENIDFELKKLAKAYLSFNNIKRAYEIALEISDINTKVDLYYNLLRSDKSLDFSKMLDSINKIQNNAAKQGLTKNLALDRVEVNPEQAARMAFLLEDPAMKEETMRDIVARTIQKDTSIALKLSYLIDDVNFKIQILYGIIAKLHEQKKLSECVEILYQIINLLSDTSKIDLSANDYFNTDYIDFRDAIHMVADLVSPRQAESIIENIPVQSLKEKVSKDLLDYIYEFTEEKKTRLEERVLYSQYYIFNTLVSNLNNFVKDFALIGGNLSNNLLVKDFNFNLVFLSLFKYDFGIFPVLDRVYNDLKYNYNKGIAYYVYPSIDKHKAGELEIINNTLKQFILSNISNAPGQVFVFNLDFIPYLGKPTVILSRDPEVSDNLKLKISKKLKDSINVIIDDDFFAGGASLDNLKSICPPNKCKVVNLIVSYEFINNYDYLRALVHSLV